MKLIKINKPNVSESRDVPGLLNCRIEYEVKGAKGKLEYGGPKFTPAMWHQVLSFFRWTFKEHQSESQVRLYVNPKLGRWGAWAFPQVARTGMTAREIPTPESPEKARARFAFWASEPSDDWLYFGTVHHHCSASAFQSSTDEQNEWNQDGLHITVGKMGDEQHDIAARLYLDGNCYEPDLSRFWPLDASLTAMVPPPLHHELARFQMGGRVTVDFPDAWRENIVEVQRETPAWPSEQEWGMERRESYLPLMTRIDEALEEIHHRCAASGVDEEQWVSELGQLVTSDITLAIIESCLKYNVSPDELLAEASQGQFAY